MPEIILDSTSINGLLRMAGDEGLLHDREDHGDRLLFSLKNRQLPDWHRQQILEQVILNSRIHTINEIPFDWLKGEFLEINLIKVAKLSPDWNDEGRAVAPEIIEGMLRAQGYQKSFDEWISIFERSNLVFEEVLSYEEQNPGTKIDALSTMVRAMVDRKFRESEEYKLGKKWNDAYSEVRPFMSAFEEFLKLSEYASSTTHYLKTPTYRLSPNLINLQTANETENDLVKVFRITTNELGFLPICSSDPAMKWWTLG